MDIPWNFPVTCVGKCPLRREIIAIYLLDIQILLQKYVVKIMLFDFRLLLRIFFGVSQGKTK